MDLMENTVTIKASTNGITVVLDGSKSFDEIKKATAAKFKASASFLGNAKMAITFDGLEMTEEQKSELLKTISDNCELQVTAFYNTKEEMNKSTTGSRYRINMHILLGKLSIMIRIEFLKVRPTVL